MRTRRSSFPAVLLVAVLVTGAAVVATTPMTPASAATTRSFAHAYTPVVSGSGVVGETLRASVRAWSPAATLRYAWLADGKAVSGATSSTLRLTSAFAGKRMSVRATGTRSGYRAATRTSTQTSAILRTFTATPVPRISGTAAVGSTLTILRGSWKPVASTFSYRWSVAGKSITGATSPTYTIRAADAGKTITASVTGTMPGYRSVTKVSAATEPVAAPREWVSTPAPTLLGVAEVGRVLTADPGEWDPEPTSWSYRWALDGSDVPGATASEYTVQSSDRGASITVAVTGHRDGYPDTTVSSDALVVAGRTETLPDTLTTDRRLSDPTVTYVVPPAFVVPRGRTLTVGPGVVVKFAQGASMPVEGSLVVAGTTASPAVLTSILDDSVAGDTNGDGDETAPAQSDWWGIYGALPGAVVDITSARVLYGAGVNGAQLRLTSSTIDGDVRASRAADAPGQTIVVSGNTVRHGGIRVASDSTDPAAAPVVVTDNVVNGATTPYAIEIRDERLRPASLTGNTTAGNRSDALAISGNLVEDWRTPTSGPPLVVDDSVDTNSRARLTIEAGVSLLLPPGSVLQFGKDAVVGVRGTLVARGTGVAPVVLTSVADDSVPGDADGTSGTPRDDDWQGVSVDAGASIDLEGTQVLHGIGVRGDRAAVRIVSSSVQGGISAFRDGGARFGSPAIVIVGDTVTRGGIRVEAEDFSVGAPPVVVTGNTVSSVADGYAIQVEDWRMHPTRITGNVLASGNHWNAISLSGHIVEDWTVPTGGPAFVVDDPTDRLSWGFLSVENGVTMTVPAGTVLKFGSRAALHVLGTLVLAGTTEAPITLTAFLDDSVGGDLDGDGAASTPSEGSWNGWQGISLGLGSAGRAVVKGTDVTIRYADVGIVSQSERTAVQLDDSTVSHVEDTCLEMTGVDSASYFHGTLADCATGVATRDQTPFDATQVDWGSAAGPAPFGTGPGAEGAVQVVPWVGYVAPTPPPAAPAGGSSAATTCSVDTVVIAVRGSGEVPGGEEGTATDPANYDLFTYDQTRHGGPDPVNGQEQRGTGATLSNFLDGQQITYDPYEVRWVRPGLLDAVNAQPDADTTATRVLPLNYPASAVDDFFVWRYVIGDTQVKTLNRGKFERYMRSIAMGVNELEQSLAAIHSRCPSVRVQLSGYSQGALVVRLALADLAAHRPDLTASEFITGVFLIADPLNNSSSAGTGRHFGTDGGVHEGAVAKLFDLSVVRDVGAAFLGDGVIEAYPSNLIGVTGSYCDAHDLFCSPDELDVAHMIDVHSGYRARDLSAMVQWGAQLPR